MSSPIALASEYWQKQGVKLRPPANRAEIVSVFLAYQQRPTRDVLELYESLDGFTDHQSCCHHFSLWSLAEIEEKNAHNPTTDIWFADYLIESHYFSLHPEDQSTSSVHAQYFHLDGQTESVRVADSLEDFLRRLVEDPESVHVFPLGTDGSQGHGFSLSGWWNRLRNWLRL
ncbi:MAG: hypothetical protein U0996_22410 [Planctomycetaceae bacterium]